MIKVKKEWIEAVNYVMSKKEWDYSQAKLIKSHKEIIDTNFETKSWDRDDENVKCLNEIKDLDILLSILLHEYEIELSDEDMLLKTHTYYLTKNNTDYDIGFLHGLEYAMDKLKFKY